jgi:hypothetical protein
MSSRATTMRWTGLVRSHIRVILASASSAVEEVPGEAVAAEQLHSVGDDQSVPARDSPTKPTSVNPRPHMLTVIH